MKKRILNYMNTIDTLIDKYQTKNQDTSFVVTSEELTKTINEHLIQISFFQHERLIHLIVTVLFAILTVGSIFFTIVTSNISILILTIFLLILLVPYVKHYYLLENGVQKMYVQYDKLVEIKNTIK